MTDQAATSLPAPMLTLARTLAQTPAQTLAQTPTAELQRSLASTGIWLDLGAATVRLHSDVPELAEHIKLAYRHFPLVTQADWADLHVHVDKPRSLRRWFRPQVVFHCDGQFPFEPFPQDSALPMFEWGSNWLIGRRFNHLLLLHAGVVERDGIALVMPAVPGSGKSTLTAALSLRGWRLLSDEFGSFDPSVQAFRAMLKPVALKNESIEVIKRFAPHARFGPDFPKTRKGTVAHLAAETDAVARRHELALPGAVVLPRWQAGSATRWMRLRDDVLFNSLAFNAFNYQTLGAAGFHAALHLTQRCLGWELVYSDLDDALAALDAAWPEIVAQQRQLSGAAALAEATP